MNYQSKAKAKKATGLSYYGMVNNSTKHEKAFKYNEMVYSIYLSPANSSGYEVCPGRTTECTRLCLNTSGRNLRLAKEHITKSRIAKTKLFFEERDFTVRWIFDEINSAKAKAEKLGYRFSIRLNNTSDISPEDFYIETSKGKLNILEAYSDVQFYDYTKCEERLELMKKYTNYDVTFSYTGYNDVTCMRLLSEGKRVAMVFKQVPETYRGYRVVYGDNNDLRYSDPKGVIIGLKFKKVRSKLMETDKFVIQ